MMFLRHYWFYALGLLPVRKRYSRYLRVVLGYYDCKDAITTWHRSELEKLDTMYKLQQASLRLVVAQNKAKADGISPMSPNYPTILDFQPNPFATAQKE